MKKGSEEHLNHLKQVGRLGGIAKAKQNLSPLERFQNSYVIDANGCWIWTAYLTRGYGSFKVDKKQVKAARWAYEHFKGEYILSKKVYLVHQCKVAACVNPDHFYLKPNLNEKQKQEIRNAILKESAARLAKRFNVSRQRIWQICRGLKTLDRKRCKYEDYQGHDKEKNDSRTRGNES